MLTSRRPARRSAVRPGGGRARREASVAEDPACHAAQSCRAVIVGGIPVGHHRHREADGPAPEQRSLVHQAAAGGTAPPALQEDPEARKARGAGIPPPLPRDDRGQEPARVGPVGPRHEQVDAPEEAGLVLGGHLRVAPVAGHREPPHARARGETAQPRISDPAVHGVGAGVVGAHDHRPELGSLRGARVATPYRAQVGHEHHRLGHARRHVAPPGGVAVQLAPASRSARTKPSRPGEPGSAGPAPHRSGEGTPAPARAGRGAAHRRRARRGDRRRGRRWPTRARAGPVSWLPRARETPPGACRHAPSRAGRPAPWCG